MDITSLITELDAIDLRLTRMASIGGGLLSHTTQGKKASSALRTAILSLDTATPVPAPTTIIGACPLTGGMSAAAGQRVIDRWGQGVAVRMFASGGFGTIAPVLPDAGSILASWKPTLGQPLDRAAVLAALAPLPAGSKVAVWHEPDVKARKGEAVAPMIALHREFAAIVRAERPDLDVMGVLSAWTWQGGYDPTTYIDPASFDVLGIDLDDPNVPKSYTDYLPAAREAAAWAAAHGITRWTVPEFGLPRSATDTTGTGRAAWMTQQVEALRALPTPPEDVCLFESTSYAGTELTSTVEQDAWRNA